MISIHPKAGTYIASPTQLQFTQKELVLKTGTIQVGEKTTLHGWFTEPLEFMGFKDDDEAIFYLGKSNGDLLTPETYFYDVTFIIAPDRIGKSYKAGSFRDSFLRKKNGEYYWK